MRSSIDQARRTLILPESAWSPRSITRPILAIDRFHRVYRRRTCPHRVHATASYLESRPNNAAKSRAFIANFSEILTPRWDITEVLTRSHEQTWVSFGGGFISNLVSASAQYETFYVF